MDNNIDDNFENEDNEILDLKGFKFVYYMPPIKVSKKKSGLKGHGSIGCPVLSRKSKVIPVNIPGKGIRYIPKAYGGASCDKYDNCFTCPLPEDQCTGGRNI